MLFLSEKVIRQFLKAIVHTKQCISVFPNTRSAHKQRFWWSIVNTSNIHMVRKWREIQTSKFKSDLVARTSDIRIALMLSNTISKPPNMKNDRFDVRPG